MISGRLQRRRRALAWSTFVSAIIHLVVLTLLFYVAARIIVQSGSRESVTQTSVATVQQQQHQQARPRAAPKHVARTVKSQEAPAARTPPQELARSVNIPAPALPQHRTSLTSPLERDEAGFAKEVAQLNRQNDPHAIPTIDPGSQESPTKSYGFVVPSSLRGSEHGNGIITPTTSWHDKGQNCYYGRYEFTYPDGAMESGSIVWPFCYDPGLDPFKEPPHEIPFPLPLPGFKLASDSDLPPIEKSVYEQWARASGNSTP